MVNNAKSWHKEVIPQAVEPILGNLLRSHLDSFYLAGGTALALWHGGLIGRPTATVLVVGTRARRYTA